MNHQSQLRVPPTPLTEASLLPSPSRNCRPEFISAVVLPAPGAPMNMYQGSSYRYEPGLNSERPALARSLTIASSKRLARISASRWLAVEPVDRPFTSAACVRRRLNSPHTSQPIHKPHSTSSVMVRAQKPSNGRTLPKATSGKAHHTSALRNNRPSVPMTTGLSNHFNALFMVVGLSCSARTG